MSPHKVAAQYIGQTEIKGNMGFKDPCFEGKMREVGFQDTHAWCAYFQELVFKEAYPEKFTELDQLFSASAVKTFNNFKKASYLIGLVPQQGTLVIWQKMKEGKPHWSGHAGIVSSVQDQERFMSIEGNTNNNGGREGIMVIERQRQVIPDVKNGLKIMGFIQI